MKMNCLPDMRTLARRLACLVAAVTTLAGWTVSAATLHVWPDSPNPMPPYDSWGNTATNIQNAVDAAADGDTVLVAGGVYSTGGRAVVGTMTNRVAIDKAITVESLMGPEVTTIEGTPAAGGGNGDGAVRCVYLGTNAVLSGFTLTNGHTSTNEDYGLRGGGAWCESSSTMTNCIITGNSAFDSGGGVWSSAFGLGGTLYNCTLTGNSTDYAGSFGGGGSFGGTLYNCTLTGNSAASIGGGTCFSTLYNCTLSGNSANFGGGAAGGTLYNCTLSDNSAEYGGGFIPITFNVFGVVHLGALYSCTVTGNSADDGGGVYGAARLYNCVVYFNAASSGADYAGESYVEGGAGGSTTEFFPPTFDYSCTMPMPTNGMGNITNAPAFVDQLGGNLRLQSNSPCINAGNNTFVTNLTDLDGHPRIVSGTVDMGAYEFQGSGSIISYAWLQQCELPMDGSADTADPDGDLMNSWQEWLAGTDPTNALSFFHIGASSKNSPASISFLSSSNRTYTLWRMPTLAPPDWTPVPGEQAIPGNGGPLTLSDPTNAPQQFYRVEVNLP